jgi:hypothetical protein
MEATLKFGGTAARENRPQLTWMKHRLGKKADRNLFKVNLAESMLISGEIDGRL